MATTDSNSAKDNSANFGFEAPATRDSAFVQSETKPQVVSAAKNNMVALPSQLFYSTQIPVCLWFLAKNKHDGKRRDRREHTLFIDARDFGRWMNPNHQFSKN